MHTIITRHTTITPHGIITRAVISPTQTRSSIYHHIHVITQNLCKTLIFAYMYRQFIDVAIGSIVVLGFRLFATKPLLAPIMTESYFILPDWAISSEIWINIWRFALKMVYFLQCHLENMRHFFRPLYVKFIFRIFIYHLWYIDVFIKLMCVWHMLRCRNITTEWLNSFDGKTSGFASGDSLSYVRFRCSIFLLPFGPNYENIHVFQWSWNKNTSIFILENPFKNFMMSRKPALKEMRLKIITMTSLWARWRLKSPASQLITEPFDLAQIKENIKALRHWPLWWEFTGDRWIPRIKGQ